MALSRRKKIIIGATALVVLLIIIIISVLASRKDTPEVTVVKLETRRELRSNVTASGEVRPIQFMNLTSEVQGRIEEIYVKEGDQVTKGQPLVRLDPTQLQSNTEAQLASVQSAQSEIQVSQSQVTAAQNQYSQAQQGLNASQAQVDTAVQQVATARQQVASAQQQVIAAQTDVDNAQKSLDIANREFKRTTNLFEENVYSRQQFDQAKDTVDQAQIALRNAQSRLQSQKLAVNEANARVNEANSRVKEAQARVNQQAAAVRDSRRAIDTANLNVNSTQSRANQQAALLRGQQNQRNKTMQVAPINGVIAEIPSKVGTFAVAGLSTTALLTIADMSMVNVEVKVDETEIDKVEVGQRAKIKVDALGEREIAGEVTQKTPLALGKSQTTGGLSTNINVQEAKEFRVVIQLKEMTEEIRSSLRPGMSATATITTKTVENVISVPLQAVIEKQPDAGASPAPTIANSVPVPGEKPKPIKGVYILEENKVKFVEVTTGITGESDVQITSGLNEGMEVITGPSRVLKTLKDGDIVKRQEKPGPNANKT